MYYYWISVAYCSWLIFGVVKKVKAIVCVLGIGDLESRFVHCVKDNGFVYC